MEPAEHDAREARNKGESMAEDARPRDGARERIPVSATPDPDEESLMAEDEDDRPRDRLGRARPETTTKRVDKIEATRRREIIRKAIVQGFGTADIIREISTNTDWGISVRQIERYIAQALAMIVREGARDKKLETGKAIERNEMILRKALAPGKGKEMDLFIAIRANQSNARLMGLEAPTRHAHGSDPDLPVLPGGDFILLVQEVVETSNA